MFKCTQLKILLLKLGIKEVVWQTIITNFQILSFLYKYFTESRYKLLYELTVTSLFNVGTCKVRNEIETKRKRTKRNETKPIETKRNQAKLV